MAAGCTNPAAVNYNPAATPDDGSCIYLVKVDDNCYKFTDVDTSSIVDKSFTMSYSIQSDNWVFFHDYIPDYYFHTREKLHLVKNKKVYTANEGASGVFLGNPAKSFFIDVVFASKDEMTLNAVNWISEIIDRSSGSDSEFGTLSHITIWNSYQCTGRIPVSQFFNDAEVTNIRKTKSEWNFNEFRDLVKTRGNTFLEDIFNDYAVITSELDANLPWYEQKLLEDKYFIVRFEFDNAADKIVFLHDVDIDANKSYR